MLKRDSFKQKNTRKDKSNFKTTKLTKEEAKEMPEEQEQTVVQIVY